VLKGAVPLVVLGDGAVVLVDGGHPALAVAGSGDVLAGIIGALLAQGLAPDDAALAGVELHQRAGARLQRGALASDVADAVGAVLADLRK
jgi:ADP-dependent NAD(P)H-hydrate dehydratase / NAD(P)H-hydrate epimerase